MISEHYSNFIKKILKNNQGSITLEKSSYTIIKKPEIKPCINDNLNISKKG